MQQGLLQRLGTSPPLVGYRVHTSFGYSVDQCLASKLRNCSALIYKILVEGFNTPQVIRMMYVYNI